VIGRRQRRRLPRLAALALTVAAFSVAVAGCALGSDQAERDVRQALVIPETTMAPPTTVPAPCPQTVSDVAIQGTLPVPKAMPPGTLQTIQTRGYLVVGVDQNSLRLSYYNPSTQSFRGLEIDLLHAIAMAIFDDPNAIEFKVILSSQREDVINDGIVDIVADAMTRTCDRDQRMVFTNAYLTTEQNLLVRKDSSVTSIDGLNGKHVCATIGSTSIQKLDNYPAVHPFPVAARTDCLVALQQGKVDAITSDNTILQGFQDQDPNTKILPATLEREPYGMLVGSKPHGSKGEHQDLANFVNGVLAQLDHAGKLSALQTCWLAPATDPRTATC